MSVEASVATGLILTPAANAAAYRVVQEGLTNAHRHGAGSAAVRTHAEGAYLHIDIQNPVNDDHQNEGSGFGLVGMRERVTAAGGTLDIRARSGTFAIHVTLPLATRDGSR
jgi:signal transduction histidine kinase